MNVVLEVKVLSKGDHPERSEPQLRKGDRPWKEAGSETAGRFTRTGSEATPSVASGLMTDKPRWSKLRRRKSGGRAVKEDILT